MKIGNIELKNNIVLAPMAGVTDLAYRLICKDMGVDLVVSEMISAKGIYYGDKKTNELMAVDKSERPIAIQIFGSDPEIMGSVVKNHLNHREDIDIIDINMGCPAPKIVKNGDGSALMKNPELAKRVLSSVVEASDKPVTLKIRTGWSENNKTGIEIANIAEEVGIDAITVHGRTREMFYTGKADYDYIKKVKESVSIPVIGNGDIFEPEDASYMMEYTGCDGIAIGRGAKGNPWIFKRIINRLNGKADIIPNIEDIVKLSIQHLNLICSIKGERIGVKEMRKHIAWYVKGLPESNVLKDEINRIDNLREMEERLWKYYLSNKEEI